jgi:hypothetical protein
MGNEWIDAEVFGDEPEHLLGQYYKNAKARFWLKHTEELVEELLTNPRIKFDARVLADKIKDPFASTLAEMESAVFLLRQGFEIVLEPSAPDKGPDIRADWGGVSYFIEVRAAGFSEEEDRRNKVTREMFGRLKDVPSAYFVQFTIGDEYAAGSPRTKAALDTIIEVLDVLKQKQIKKATFYYAPPDGKLPEQESKIRDTADLIVRFEDLGKELEGTPASLMKKLKLPPEPVKDHERLKKILGEKRKQLPKSSRGIITLEVSEQFMLSDFSVESALYGDMLLQFKPVARPDEPIGEPEQRRNNRGFFRRTSRVSAIVIQRRVVVGGRVRYERKVYPTNRANDDTIRLTFAELQRFGDVEDRDHLTAEHAPNHVDDDVEPNE